MTAAPPGFAVPQSNMRNASAAPHPGSGLGFVFLVLFVFASTSRVFDSTLPSLHIPMVLAVFAGLLALPTGALPKAFQTNVGKLMALFTVWMLICVPFSMWRGGSVMMLQSLWSKSYILLVMIAGMASSLRRVRGIMITIACSSILVACVAILRGDKIQGRLTMETGFFSNPNDLAQFLLVGLCFLPVLMNGKNGPFLRLPLVVVAIGMLYAIFATGSRATLFGLILVGFVVFLRSSGMYRIGVLAVAAMGLLAFLVLTPKSIQTRLSTLSGDDTRSAIMGNTDGIAAASAQSRKQLLLQSIRLTLKNPAFGVGPGVFQFAAAEESHESGEHALWRESHNSFTQVSSETGIPGLLLFLGANLACVVGLLRIWKRCGEIPQMQGYQLQLSCLLLGYVAFAATAAFASVAYQFNFSMMIGLAAASLGAAQREFTASPTPAADTARTIHPGPGQWMPQRAARAVPPPASSPQPVTAAFQRVPSAPRYPKNAPGQVR